jgi:hypothetical protein
MGALVNRAMVPDLNENFSKSHSRAQASFSGTGSCCMLTTLASSS